MKDTDSRGSLGSVTERGEARERGGSEAGGGFPPAQTKEFDWIAKFFAPLATHPAALGLKDDAALLVPPPGCELVITQDAMTAGVHFFADDPPDLIARKLLRVNLSDLAAKGAKPLGYFLSLLLPPDLKTASLGLDPRVQNPGHWMPGSSPGKAEIEREAWLSAFASGLATDQAQYNLSLLGGDTSRILGPLTLSLTAIGTVPNGKMIKRSGARPGDAIFVTGTIGDAALGLKVRRGELPQDDFLLSRYLLPEPRFFPMTSVTAAMDISDGLIQDAGHLAAASGVRLVIEAEKVPFSKSALHHQPSTINHQLLLTGGDDYELLFTAPSSFRASHLLGFPCTKIGRVEFGSGVVLLDASGQEIALQQKGWSHF